MVASGGAAVGAGATGVDERVGVVELVDATFGVELREVVGVVVVDELLVELAWVEPLVELDGEDDELLELDELLDPDEAAAMVALAVVFDVPVLPAASVPCALKI